MTPTDADGFKPPPNLKQGPKKRAAKYVSINPESPAQRKMWFACADARGISVSAWLRDAADKLAAAERGATR